LSHCQHHGGTSLGTRNGLYPVSKHGLSSSCPAARVRMSWARQPLPPGIAIFSSIAPIPFNAMNKLHVSGLTSRSTFASSGWTAPIQNMRNACWRVWRPLVWRLYLRAPCQQPLWSKFAPTTVVIFSNARRHHCTIASRHDARVPHFETPPSCWASNVTLMCNEPLRVISIHNSTITLTSCPIIVYSWAGSRGMAKACVFTAPSLR
jgi:hypothetical protein